VFSSFTLRKSLPCREKKILNFLESLLISREQSPGEAVSCDANEILVIRVGVKLDRLS
jgi:hypothetical protein